MLSWGSSVVMENGIQALFVDFHSSSFLFTCSMSRLDWNNIFLKIMHLDLLSLKFTDVLPEGSLVWAMLFATDFFSIKKKTQRCELMILHPPPKIYIIQKL